MIPYRLLLLLPTDDPLPLVDASVSAGYAYTVRGSDSPATAIASWVAATVNGEQP